MSGARAATDSIRSTPTEAGSHAVAGPPLPALTPRPLPLPLPLPLAEDIAAALTVTVTVTVQEVVRESPDAVSLVLRTDPGEQLSAEPGQFLTVRMPGGQARCYSLSRLGDDPRITVKRVPGGIGSNWLCDTAEKGTRLTVLPPAGAFTRSRWDTDALFVAAGSGITPVLPMVAATLERGSGRVALVCANRSPESVLFRDELRALAQTHPSRLIVHHLLSSLQGRPGREQLAHLVAPYAAREAYLCGPQGFMAAAQEALRDHGVPRERIHREVFVSLTGDVFDATPTPRPRGHAQATPEPTGVTGAAEATEPTALTALTALTVDLDGRSHSVAWAHGTRLLDALVAAGLDAPYSCREGACGACACRVLSGNVTQETGSVLTEEDRAEGYVLACQALPDGSGGGGGGGGGGTNDDGGGQPVRITYD